MGWPSVQASPRAPGPHHERLHAASRQNPGSRPFVLLQRAPVHPLLGQRRAPRAVVEIRLAPIGAREGALGGARFRARSGDAVLEANRVGPPHDLRLAADGIERALVAVLHRKAVGQRALPPRHRGVGVEVPLLVDGVRATRAGDDVPQHHVASDGQRQELAQQRQACALPQGGAPRATR
eukprot:6607368-Prymnesium_polylepis.1